MRSGSATEKIQSAKRHDSHATIDSRNSLSVIHGCCHDSRREGSMAVIVPRVVVSFDEIPADDIVHVTVLVVVHAVTGNLFRVDPDVFLGDFRMNVIETGIDDGHDDGILFAGLNIPG